MWPERFSNKTNGVTPRRFVALANPGLRELITRTIGDRWIAHLDELRRLEPCAADAAFREEWRAVKRANKARLAELVRRRTGVDLDPSWLFDIQVKRIHEYKRQHLNVLHIVTLYRRLKDDPAFDPPPRAFIFGGKAAPGYFLAKRIIKLINAVAETVNADPDVNTRMRVAFLPNFDVRSAQLIYPAADLSEQISMAGKEASGTGNMKFTLNGALTIGTLDGANVEIREEVGRRELLPLRPHGGRGGARQGPGVPSGRGGRRQSGAARRAGHDCRWPFLERRRASVFRPLVENLLHADPFLVLADYAGVRGLPGARERGVDGSGALDPHVDPQRRARRQVLVGPRDPGVLRARSGTCLRSGIILE